MKKIGIVAEYFYPHLGGISDHIYFFSKELIKQGYDVTVLTGHEGQPCQVNLPDKLRVIRLGKSFPIYSNNSICKVTLGWNLGKKIQRVLEEENFDILHLQSPIDATLQLLFLKYSQTVTVGTLHSYFGNVLYFKLFKKVIQGYLNKLDGIIAVSSACIEAMDRYFEVDYEIIPNGIDLDFFTRPADPLPQYDDGSENILFLARLDPRNGLHILLEAFPLVLKEVPNARLIIAGDGPLRAKYEKQAGSLLNEKIFFDGLIFENRPEYFASSQVFCYPANHATFGVTLLESMAAATPVVATENPGFLQVLNDGINGVVARQDDPVDLARKLIHVLKNPTLSDQLVKNGSEFVRSYSWPRITQRILNYYDQVYLRKYNKPFSIAS
jgi:phosphatidylinositol alpha-mannosyltransferase